jgi:hypothetical protein
MVNGFTLIFYYRHKQCVLQTYVVVLNTSFLVSRGGGEVQLVTFYISMCKEGKSVLEPRD